MDEQNLIIRRRDRVSLAETVSDLDRALRRGELLSVAPGAYVEGVVWQQLEPVQRHRVRVIASVERLRSPAVISHYAAAALWGLDIWRRWPATVDLLVPSDGTRSSGSFRRHRVELARHDVVRLGDFFVTSPAQTAVDIGTVVPFSEAVVTMDSALRRRAGGNTLTTVSELLDAAHRLRGLSGSRRTLSAAHFASGQSESALESMSRARIAEAGFPDPVLQHEFREDDGFRARVDFWWPDHRLIGEADGRGKYLAATTEEGAAAAVLAEKNREDRLRRLVSGFVRWEYSDVVKPGRLTSILASAGLRSSTPHFDSPTYQNPSSDHKNW